MADPQEFNSPSFPFYWRDWLSSQRVMLMSLAAQGLYLRLICLRWAPGGLPADPASISTLAGNPPGFADLWREVSPMFEERDGLLINPRQDIIREERIEFRNGKRRGAEAANAKIRAQRDAQCDAQRDANDDAKAPSSSASSSASALPSSIPSIPTELREGGKPPARQRASREPFIAPTREEIVSWLTDSGYSAELFEAGWDAGRIGNEIGKFFEHYGANGWMAGRVPMKDWKLAFQKWIRLSVEYTNRQPEKRAGWSNK